jgi:hypothetical protein
MDARQETRNAFALLLLCSALTIGLWFIPYVGFLTYPFRIFVTLIHESGHAIAALLTLGHVWRITLDWDGNGLTETSGGVGFFISSAGYLGATLFGAGLLLVLRRAANARRAAIFTGSLLLLITVFLGGNLTVWIAGLVFGAALLAIGLFAPRGFTHFFMSFLAVQSLLNALYDLKTLVYLTTFDPTRHTDAQNMARATGGFLPASVWSFAWAVMSLAILAATLFVYYKSLKHPPRATEPAPAAYSASA